MVCLTEQEQSSKPSGINTFCCCCFALYFLCRNVAHGTCQLRSQHLGTSCWFYQDASDKVFNYICQELKLCCEKKIIIFEVKSLSMRTEPVGVSVCVCARVCKSALLSEMRNLCSPACGCECEIF